MIKNKIILFVSWFLRHRPLSRSPTGTRTSDPSRISRHLRIPVHHRTWDWQNILKASTEGFVVPRYLKGTTIDEDNSALSFYLVTPISWRVLLRIMLIISDSLLYPKQPSFPKSLSRLPKVVAAKLFICLKVTWERNLEAHRDCSVEIRCHLISRRTRNECSGAAMQQCSNAALPKDLIVG